MGDGIAYSDARECVRAAKCAVREVKPLLGQPTAEKVEQAAAILREVEVQLGCAAALMRKSNSGPDLELQHELEELQDQVAVLSRFLAEADKLLSGWLRGVRTRHGGYTARGQAAPLVLVNKVAVEG